MGLRNRLRVRPVSRAVIDYHNRHDGITYPELKAEEERAAEQRKRAREEGKYEGQ